MATPNDPFFLTEDGELRGSIVAGSQWIREFEPAVPSACRTR